MSDPPLKDEPPVLAQPVAEIDTLLGHNHVQPAIAELDNRVIAATSPSETHEGHRTQQNDELADETEPADVADLSEGDIDSGVLEELDVEEFEDDWESEDESMLEVALEGLSDEDLYAHTGEIPLAS